MRDKFGRFMKGHTESIATKEKRSKSLMGNSNGFQKGFTPWNKKDKIAIKCIICNKLFEVWPYRKNAVKFCSMKCMGKWKSKNCTEKNNPNYRGGERKGTTGYIYILKPNHPFCDKNNCVKRSRLVAEKHLGRYLKPEEVVHHINEIKDDDRPENLRLFYTNSEHMSFHDTKQCRDEISGRYRKGI